MIAALLIWPLGEAFQLVSVCCWVLSVLIWMRMDHGTGRASWRLGSRLPWASDVARTEASLQPRPDLAPNRSDD